jgi:hypothetical protein
MVPISASKIMATAKRWTATSLRGAGILPISDMQKKLWHLLTSSTLVSGWLSPGRSKFLRTVQSRLF